MDNVDYSPEVLSKLEMFFNSPILQDNKVYINNREMSPKDVYKEIVDKTEFGVNFYNSFSSTLSSLEGSFPKELIHVIFDAISQKQ
ncbi:MAG: hypothetical protein AABW50_05105 [Nanoarchaeota archaeon]